MNGSTGEKVSLVLIALLLALVAALVAYLVCRAIGMSRPASMGTAGGAFVSAAVVEFAALTFMLGSSNS